MLLMLPFVVPERRDLCSFLALSQKVDTTPMLMVYCVWLPWNDGRGVADCGTRTGSTRPNLVLELAANLICSKDQVGTRVRLLAFWGSWVRTLSAILLTIVMGLPMAMPLFASGETALPACCRRDGKHHCMGKSMLQMDIGTTPAVSAAQSKCPQFPKMLGVSSHSQLGLSTSTAVFAGIVSHPALSPQTLSNYRVSLLRSHQKRGPPLSFVLC